MRCSGKAPARQTMAKRCPHLPCIRVPLSISPPPCPGLCCLQLSLPAALSLAPGLFPASAHRAQLSPCVPALPCSRSLSAHRHEQLPQSLREKES